MSLTEKQQQFAVNKAAGVKNKEAAVAAGYSAKTGDTIAARLMQRPDIKKAIAKAKRELKSGGQQPSAGFGDGDLTDEKKRSMPKSHYADPIDFLTDLMNHKHMPVAMRADAAKQLLPYKHARIGEQGKKQNAKEAAQKIARAGNKAGGKPKFATKAPPPLKIVGGTG